MDMLHDHDLLATMPQLLEGERRLVKTTHEPSRRIRHPTGLDILLALPLGLKVRSMGGMIETPGEQAQRRVVGTGELSGQHALDAISRLDGARKVLIELHAANVQE
jgi:hypothetical protein